MAKEVLIYGNIDTYSAETFINSMEAAANDDISIRINTNGGDPQAGWGMIAKLAEHKGNKLVKVDGKAYSMGAYFLAYADYTEALDVSKFIIHRAGYPSWIEESDHMTDAMWESLDSVNASLRKALENKIDVVAFLALPQMQGKSMDDIFSNDGKLDIEIDAKEAKKIGLINKINPITPAKKKEINAMMYQIEISAKGKEYSIAASEDKNPTIKKDTKMTIEKLKAEHPEIYASIVALGVAKEKDRCGAWAAFITIDPEAVTKGIKDGVELSATAMAEFTMKSISAKTLAAVNAEAASVVKTAANAEGKTEKEKEISAFEASTRAGLGLK